MWTSSPHPSLSMPHEAVKERRHLRTRTQLRRPVVAAFYWCNGLQFERSGIAVSLFVQWTQNRWAWHAIDISSASSYFLTNTKVAPTTLKRYYKICYGYRIKHNVSTKARVPQHHAQHHAIHYADPGTFAAARYHAIYASGFSELCQWRSEHDPHAAWA